MRVLQGLLVSVAVLLQPVHLSSFYPASGDVIELTPANFDREVLKSDSIWVVEFYAPWCGHCKSLAPEFSLAAKGLRGVVKVGAVNADEHKQLSAQYNIKGFPTIMIFGPNKQAPVEYNGKRTAEGIINEVLQQISKQVRSAIGGKGSSSSGSSDSGSDDVVELTDSNFDRLVLNSEDVWLVEFFAPWCGHCKNLAPHWAKAASELKGKVKLGALDATVHQAKAHEYNVRGYPTIKFFPGGKKSPSDASDYDGGRTSSDIVTWALEKHSESVPPPELMELTSQSVFKEHCEDKTLCVISILPHILDCDSKCRNQYLNVLREMGEKYKKKGWGWIWAEAVAQTDLENSVGIGGFGYPAMAVANYKKMKYSALRGSFSNDGISEFLRDISFGRGQTLPVNGAKLPQIQDVPAWDGKDGQLPEVEDIDLSDIDLDEKDEL